MYLQGAHISGRHHPSPCLSPSCFVSPLRTINPAKSEPGNHPPLNSAQRQTECSDVSSTRHARLEGWVSVVAAQVWLIWRGGVGSLMLTQLLWSCKASHDKLLLHLQMKSWGVQFRDMKLPIQFSHQYIKQYYTCLADEPEKVWKI